ncbi:myb-like protein A [Gossypium australe]|uniref:Myb-like protein A n=1 Tax=Gossypium australe TaxID=47621 RepID=A0A5B6VTG2_9ROSI|nr:myb-like protein A [Gossypium australe]
MDLRLNQINDDGLLENMLQEAQALAANGNGGNNEIPKEMMNAAQNEEDYSRLINIDGPSSFGMAIPKWCNDNGESSERPPSAIIDNENHLALDMHQIASLYPADISPNQAARSSSVRSWDNFPALEQSRFLVKI